MSDVLREEWESDARPGWYLRYLDVRVREALGAVEALPAADDPGLPAGDRELVERVAVHLRWCAERLGKAAERAAAT